jgi:hypothetical protein
MVSAEAQSDTPLNQSHKCGCARALRSLREAGGQVEGPRGGRMPPGGGAEGVTRAEWEGLPRHAGSGDGGGGRQPGEPGAVPLPEGRSRS